MYVYVQIYESQYDKANISLDFTLPLYHLALTCINVKQEDMHYFSFIFLPSSLPFPSLLFCSFYILILFLVYFLTEHDQTYFN
jgi:hypothetical protein